MAFNASNATITTDFTLVFGINLKNKLLPYVNLDNEHKAKLGLKTFENEPVYIVDKQDQNTGASYKQAIIEMYVKLLGSDITEVNEKVYPIRFYVDDIIRPTSSTGKNQYINNDGESNWMPSADSTPDARFMKNVDGLRVAYNGEVDFIEAFKEMIGTKSGISISNWKKIFQGDFTEIRQTLVAAKKWVEDDQKKGEKLFALLYYVTSKEKVDDYGNIKKYFTQNIYLKAFNDKLIRKTINSNEEKGYTLKGFYKNDNVITNYLSVFNPSDYQDNENIRNNGNELPF